MASVGEGEVLQGIGAGGLTPKAREEGRGKHGGNPPAMVILPDAARRNHTFPPPLKLEVEESSAENMSPRNMWQVYALGGFMVVRWIWARWRERKDRRSSEDSSS